jgi:curved DNA-binding protein CbpA
VAASRDPYAVLGVAQDAPDAELRAAYRRLVQLHHPDHNGGSEESERRFEEVQEAYAEARRLRQAGGGSGARSAAGANRRRAGATRAGAPPSGQSADPGVEARLADLERQLREANLARERARRAAREAAAAARADSQSRPRASDEDLGYVSTDDSFMKILADARDELFGRGSEAREETAAEPGGEARGETRGGGRGETRGGARERRVADRAADVLEDIAARLRGEQPDPPDESS